MKNVLIIAGSDPTGGAGIQADIETMAIFGVKSAHIITAVTVQDDNKVYDCYYIPVEYIGNLFDKIFSENSPKWLKIGMIGHESTVKLILSKIKDIHELKIILDPVYASSSGYNLVTKEAWDLIKHELLPKCFLVTPNITEAQLLTGIKIKNRNDMESAMNILAKMGPENVLIKGGHLDGKPVDLLYNGKEILSFESKRLHQKDVRGTGCRFSSAITALLSKGSPLTEAVEGAKKYICDYIAGKK